MQIQCTCLTCGTSFPKYPSEIKLGRGKYCGQTCQTAGRWTLTDFVCSLCGATFQQPRGRRSSTGPVYCGDACSKIARRRQVDLICEHCGGPFTRNPAAIAAGRGRFCGKPCQNAAQENKVRVICETCGTPFDRKASAVHERTFCSDDCARLKHAEPVILDEDGLTARIPLHARDGSLQDYATIDAADAEWAGQWPWSLNAKGYATRGQGILLHRELLGLTRGDGVFGDHIDLDRLNDRRSNLRPANPSESPQNVPGRHRSSEYRGVAWLGGKKPWAAYANVGRKRVYYERFTDEMEAAEAARAARARFLPFSTD